MALQTKIVLLALVALVKSDGIFLGSENGRKIYDEDTTANPAIWRQMNNVTINAPENEVISGLIITDLREDKKGEAVIVDGGVGEKNVTIELKSPTALRGYEFHIKAYAAPEGNAKSNDFGRPLTDVNAKNPLDSSTHSNFPAVPAVVVKDPQMDTKKTDLTTKTTPLAEKTDTKRSADASTTAKTISTEITSTTSKYPTAKTTQDDKKQEKTTLLDLEKTETKRSAEELSTTKSNPEFTATSTPKSALPSINIPTNTAADKTNEPSMTPILTKVGLTHMEAQSLDKTPKSNTDVPKFTKEVNSKDGKTQIETQDKEKVETGPVPVHTFLMNNARDFNAEGTTQKVNSKRETPKEVISEYLTFYKE